MLKYLVFTAQMQNNIIQIIKVCKWGSMSIMGENITLSFYQEKYRQALMDFYLPAEKERYTYLPKEVLDLSIDDKDKHPVVVLLNDIPVGFFGLHLGEEVLDYIKNPKAILLRYFSINHPHSGKGYAKETLRLLPDFVKSNFPEVDEIVLAVNQKNFTAQRLYDKSNFKDTGIRRVSPKGPQFILSYKLK